MVGPKRNSKELPKANHAPQNGHGHWWSATSPIHYNFLNPRETTTSEKHSQQIDEIHWNLQCLQLALINRMGPILLHDRPTTGHTTSASKVEHIGLRGFASSSIFIWPLTDQLPLLQISWQLLASTTLPQPAGFRKCFPRVHQIPKHGLLCYRNKQTYFSLAKMCWL